MKATKRMTVSVDEAARVLGLSRNAVYIAARRGDLGVPVIKIGRRLVVPRSALEALLGAPIDAED